MIAPARTARNPSPVKSWLGCMFGMLLAAGVLKQSPDAAADGALVPLPIADTGLIPGPARVANYTFSVVLDPVKHTLEGSGTIDVNNPSSVELREIWLHLYLNAFKNERSQFLRDRTAGFRGDSAKLDWGYIDVQSFRAGTDELWPAAERVFDDDESEARVPLITPIAPNGHASFEVRFTAKLPSITLRTGYSDSFHFAGQWFPKLAKLELDGTFTHFPFHHLAEFYANFGDYDVTVDTPSAFVVGATGHLIKDTQAGGRRKVEYRQEAVHDFAFTAWDQFDVREEKIRGVAVRALYPKGYEPAIERELASLRLALPHYAKRYGAYPYETLTVVHPPSGGAEEAGGMEYPTLITTGGPWFGGGPYRGVELVTIHEFGHQYFYGLLASNEARFPFMDEGLNSYAEQEAADTFYGSSSIGQILGRTVSDSAAHAANANARAADNAVGQAAHTFATGSHYGSLVYSRTATILETYGRVYGRDKLAATLASYTRKFRFQHPSPDELLSAFAESYRPEQVRDLRALLFEKATLDDVVLTFSSSVRRDPGGIFDQGGRHVVGTGEGTKDYQCDALVVRRGAMHFPQEVAFYTQEGHEIRVPWHPNTTAEPTADRLTVDSAEPCIGVVVDPDRKVLLDERRGNNVYTTGSVNTDRTRVRSDVVAGWLLEAFAP